MGGTGTKIAVNTDSITTIQSGVGSLTITNTDPNMPVSVSLFVQGSPGTTKILQPNESVTTTLTGGYLYYVCLTGTTKCVTINTSGPAG